MEKFVERCQRCHVVEDDTRIIKMGCFYEMDELGLPFKHKIIESKDSEYKEKLYTLTVCKQCRGSWMAAQINWFRGVEEEEESCGSGIFIKEHGAIKEISEEEWYRRNPTAVPFRFQSESNGD
jgi:hypothetical protein